MDWIYNALFKAPNAHTLKPLLIHTSLIQLAKSFYDLEFKKKIMSTVVLCYVDCCFNYQMLNMSV